MCSNRGVMTLVIALVSIGGCQSAGTNPSGQSSGARADPSSAATPAADSGSAGAAEFPTVFRNLLEEATRDSSSWESLQLLAECREIDNPNLRSVVVYGNGVAIWEERRQFSLDHDQISTLLGFLLEADFPDLRDLYGGSGAVDAERPDAPPSVDGGVRIICRVDLDLSGYHKESAQRLKGEQSAELRALAERLLDYCEPLGEDGIGIESLEDGVKKIAAGDLAPETLRLMLHRKPEPGARSAGSGFRLMLEGTRAEFRSFTVGTGYGDEEIVAVDRSQVQNLAGRISTIGVQDLPGNLYASDYTDFWIEILDQREAVQARQFAGMTPSSHGPDQQRFDQILGALESFAGQLGFLPLN